MKVKVFATGGSIDKIYSTLSSSFEVGGPQAGTILGDANVTFEYEVESLLKKDSLELTEDDRALITATVQEEACRHILITHGTDTILETARALK